MWGTDCRGRCRRGEGGNEETSATFQVNNDAGCSGGGEGRSDTKYNFNVELYEFGDRLQQM